MPVQNRAITNCVKGVIIVYVTLGPGEFEGGEWLFSFAEEGDAYFFPSRRGGGA